MSASIFANEAPEYEAAGFWPRPIVPRSKKCALQGWQRSDPEIPASERIGWRKRYGDFGIGLLMGSPFPDGTALGALDIDHDDYTRIGRALLENPVCGRIGKKGAVFFVRVRGPLKNFEFRVNGEAGEAYGKVAECLFVKKLCVIPPTVHPETDAPYRWIGPSLLAVRPEELPIVEIGRLHDEGFFQPHAGATAILGNELDAGGL
jgi:hypothetical protein